MKRVYNAFFYAEMALFQRGQLQEQSDTLFLVTSGTSRLNDFRIQRGKSPIDARSASFPKVRKGSVDERRNPRRARNFVVLRRDVFGCYLTFRRLTNGKFRKFGLIFCRLFWRSRYLLRRLRFPLVVLSVSKNKFVEIGKE